MNCHNKSFNNKLSYYKRAFCCCSTCKSLEMKENLDKFEKVSDNTYKCKICKSEVFDFEILDHTNSMGHLILELF